MNIILFGPPGVGKGTQADNMVKNFNLYKISTGDLVREEVKKNTDLGRKIKPKIDQGLLVSDDIISDLIVKILSNKKNIRKVYIDRSDETSDRQAPRLIINEDEVKKYLLKNNFILAKLREMMFSE